jgi:O-antigen/teichoic acid export membrane protein
MPEPSLRLGVRAIVSSSAADPVALPLREALRNLSFKALSLGLERGGRLLVSVAAAAVLGRTSFGQFVYASTVTAMLALGTDLGLGIWTTRALARTGGVGDGVVPLGLALRSMATLPYAIALAAVTLVVDPGVRTAMVWLGVAALLNAFADHFAAILRGTERFADEARLNTVRAVAATGAGLLAVGVWRSIDALCAGMAAASVAGFAYGLAGVLRTHGLGGGAPLRRERVRDALRQSLPIWIAGLLSLLYFRVDTLFLHAMRGDAELGAYGAAYRFLDGALLLPAVVLAVTFPRLARAYGHEQAQRRLERQLVASLLGLGLFVAAVLFFGRQPLVETIFGTGFRRAEDALGVLALGLPVLYLNFGLTHFLVARNRERAMTLLNLMMLALNVALDLSLIPRMGGPGAAWATIISEVALTLGCLAALRSGEPARELPSARGASRTDRRAA